MHAATHRNDPAESLEAAARADKSAENHRSIVAGYVRCWPGCSSKELAYRVDVHAPIKLDRSEIGRRLSECEAAGTVHRKRDPRRSTPDRVAYVGDRDGAYWYPGPAPDSQRQKELFSD